MEKEITYSDAGVDRDSRAESKANLSDFEKAYEYPMTKLPYNTIYSVGNGKYQDHVIEGVGTKVLIAQLANKFDTIGIDAVAMTVNDIIRSGAKPVSLADNIDIHKSEPKIISELVKGIKKGANQARVPIVGGEIADVKELINGVSENPFHIICSCVGELTENEIIWGNNLEIDDVIIGLRSSGLHSNGISLVRRILFKKWGGKYNPFYIPNGFDTELVHEVLKPTKVYFESFSKVAKKFKIKAAVHITGDAYLKFGKLMKFNDSKIGFEFNNFKPQPIFQLVQDTAKDLGVTLTDKEFLKTFNLGWGFSFIVSKNSKDDLLDFLERNRVEADVIGRITYSRNLVAIFRGNKIRLI
mgnify:CR=1 FL=1